jgi:adenylosuccinate lyase
VNKGLSREDAYKIVQTCAMDVWADKNKNLKDELLKSDVVQKHLSAEEINGIFSSSQMLKNVDYIFNRTINEEK